MPQDAQDALDMWKEAWDSKESWELMKAKAEKEALMVATVTFTEFLKEGGELSVGKWGEWIKRVRVNEEKRKNGYVDVAQVGEEYDESGTTIARVGVEERRSMNAEMDVGADDCSDDGYNRGPEPRSPGHGGREIQLAFSDAWGTEGRGEPSGHR